MNSLDDTLEFDAAIATELGDVGRRSVTASRTVPASKLIIDVFVGGACAILALPAIVLIAILVKLTSRGSVFFGHIRIGLAGREFKVWKFRTMRIDGNGLLTAHLARDPVARDEWYRTQKLRNDPRVTRLGRILRATSMDELPQLWNIVRGEMSLVGPRPIVHEEAKRYGRAYSLYTSVKPGLTGLWQVSGRNNTTYERRVALDAAYVSRWTPWLDIWILMRTVVVVLTANGAY